MSNDDELTVAEYVDQQLALSPKRQVEIAEELGFSKPNIITMVKQGNTKIPLGKIGAFAKALDIDPAFFLRKVLKEYSPELWETLTSIMGEAIVSQGERRLVFAYRKVTEGHDLDLSPSEYQSILSKAFKDNLAVEKEHREGAITLRSIGRR